ncbi:MAG: hypothetical protein K1X94_07755 [Sandaracinaceae bacterium]|nr:hypothetical protein [Sandaracinaceae bacterium]
MNARSLLLALLPLGLSVSACNDPASADGDAFVATDTALRDARAEDAGAEADAHTELDAASPLDADSDDAAPTLDAPSASDASPSDDTTLVDAAAADDSAVMRRTVLPDFCPSTATAPGLYRGTLASSLNDVDGTCGIAAPGRDGELRVMLAPGQTLTATYRHAGDGVITLLERCPVVSSCVAGADDTSSGAETLTYTHSGSGAAPFYLVLDSTSTAGPQTFELDLAVTGP